ncbi:MAG: hypothetical protein V2I33_22520, partial [Kangiellaceae bacterium]|nr:hypothetical protein [Kangiellaceae bacterium]
CDVHCLLQHRSGGTRIGSETPSTGECLHSTEPPRGHSVQQLSQRTRCHCVTQSPALPATHSGTAESPVSATQLHCRSWPAERGRRVRAERDLKLNNALLLSDSHGMVS